MKYALLGLFLLCMPCLAEEFTESKPGKFFWDDDNHEDLIKPLLLLINKALEYKVESAYFCQALQEIVNLIESFDMQCEEKNALQERLHSLISTLSRKSSREVKSMARLRRAIESL